LLPWLALFHRTVICGRYCSNLHERDNDQPYEGIPMKLSKVLSIAAMSVALASMQFAIEPAWAKKAQPQGQTQWTATNGKCNGGVSKGCGPGSCRCP
jgi:hypothetical protein